MSPFAKDKCSICIVGMCCSNVCEDYKRFIAGHYGLMTGSKILSEIEYIITVTTNTKLTIPTYIKPREDWVYVDKDMTVKKVNRLWRKLKKIFRAKTA